MVDVLKVLKKNLPYSLAERTMRLEGALGASFNEIINSSQKGRSAAIDSSNHLIEKVRLNFLLSLSLKICNVVIKFFNSDYSQLDRLLALNECSYSLNKKYIEILNFSKIQKISVDILHYKDRSDLPEHIKLGIYGVQKFQYELYQEELTEFQKYVNKKQLGTEQEQAQRFSDLPQLLQNQLLAGAQKRGLTLGQIHKNLKILTQRDSNYKFSILTDLQKFYHAQIDTCDDLIDKGLHSVTQHHFEHKHSKLINPAAHRYYYTASSDPLIECEGIKSGFLRRPVSVVMAAVEYMGLVKEGGLAEAVEGLSKGMKAQNDENDISLIFPKFSNLPPTVVSALSKPEQCTTSQGVKYKVYSYEQDRVICKFIEHAAFNLPQGYQSIYGPNEESQGERFAAFSVLAADYISRKMNPDIVHIHDWHAAGIGLELKKKQANISVDGKKKRKSVKEKSPAVVFTFHNNSRSAQGRIGGGGGYNYNGLSSAYCRWGIIPEDNENLFVKIIEAADAVTTVSETFAEESQDIGGDAQGVSFAVRSAAQTGKLVGILNGANPHSWDPEESNPKLCAPGNYASLKGWKDIDTNTPLDLTYGPDDADILQKKTLAKEQLQKWVAKYQPQLKIDFSKPIVTFIGRLDAFQKGLDKFEEAIESTLKNGGQFICMGLGDHPDSTGKEIQDEKAKEILDRLQKKYTEGVFWARDYKVKEGNDKGKLYYQQGNANRPGIGPLVRAASDFVFIPSNFEPCGLVQFEGWLFGSLAIGAQVGGLADSIITKEKNAKEFNGFVFSREEGTQNTCDNAIKKALAFWKQQTPTNKQTLIQRLIKSGKQYAWTTTPKSDGHSPVTRYRYVYELAKRNQKAEGTKFQIFTQDKILRRLKVLPNKNISDRAKLEESYMVNYIHATTTKVSSKELEQLYMKFPEQERGRFPAPYGVNVNHTKYHEYGAKYTPTSTRFAVHAPNAKSINLILYDDQERMIHEHGMKEDTQSGKWEVRVPSIKPGQKYQYKINNQLKLDPYSQQNIPSNDSSKPPYSVVVDSEYKWSDAAWMTQRAADHGKVKPMSIYEMHPNTWKKKNGSYMNYRELAKDLVEHLKKGNFTHVELMGLLDHSKEVSWGYQVTGYFAPNSRMGSLEDVKYLINYLHEHNIGVILDWVPAHFSDYDYALKNFDGSHLFEANPRNPKYIFSYRNLFLKFGSEHFDYTKEDVREFLISSANFWLKEMHVDGLRVDCISSMLHSESRSDAELFLKDLNAVVHSKNPGTFTIAEDYSGNGSVLRKFQFEGLGFDFKWNTAWKHYTFKYFSSPLKSRKSSYEQIKTALNQPDRQQQIPYISHDELKSAEVYLGMFKGASHLDTLKCTSPEERIANWKAMVSFLLTSPGNKVMFSGVELAISDHWDKWVGKPTGIMNQNSKLSTAQQELIALIAALNKLYISEPALHADTSKEVEWIEDPSKIVHAYRVASKDSYCAIVHNFTNEHVNHFTITVPKPYVTHATDVQRAYQLSQNLSHIEQKVKWLALIEFMQNVLYFLFRREKRWMRHDVIYNNKKTSVLINIQNVCDITLLNRKAVLDKNSKQLNELLSTPRADVTVLPLEVFSSDQKEYGGKNRTNSMIKIQHESASSVTYTIQVPALTTIIIKENVYQK